jgi:hypothetical protein
MFKKATLAIVVAASILGASISFASDNIQISQKERDKHTQNNKTVIESPDKIHKVEKTLYVNKDSAYKDINNMKSYDVSMTNITFRLNDKVDDVFNQFSKIDSELSKNNDIAKTFQGYGKIVKIDNQTQTVLAGNVANFSNTKSIEYVNEVTNGEQSRDFIDIINSQRFFINNLRDDKKLTVFLTINGAQLDSMSKITVGGGSQESYIESPSISSYAVDQAVVIKPGEYKLINMGSDSMTDPNPLFENSGSKLYKAMIIKVSEQGS